MGNRQHSLPAEEKGHFMSVLHFWQVHNQDKLVWRVCLSTINGERLVFADVATLIAFLTEKLDGLSIGNELEMAKADEDPKFS